LALILDTNRIVGALVVLTPSSISEIEKKFVESASDVLYFSPNLADIGYFLGEDWFGHSRIGRVC